MKIHVNRVPEEGLQERATYNPAGMDMERDDIHLREPFEVDATINKADKELVVIAQIRTPLVMSCARCLEEFPFEIQTQAILSYPVGPSDVVDITEDVRQEIILNYPIIPICRKDCKGLCLRCGQNLNERTCEHQT